MTEISVQSDDFDLGREVASLAALSQETGAVASFVGYVRGDKTGTRVDGGVTAMTLEHYPGMTEAALAAIVESARQRWKLDALRVIHRIGRLQPGEQIVLVAVASRHRGDAFAACEFIMDFLKTQAPFWKKEETPEGARWVDARESDDMSARRWGSD